jgi:hypothetical protein
MEKSGLWIGNPAPDATAAKRFKREFDQFVESKEFIVK